jgi:hypothetical protein
MSKKKTKDDVVAVKRREQLELFLRAFRPAYEVMC